MSVRPSNVVTMRQITVNNNAWLFILVNERTAMNVVTMRQITVNILDFQMYECTAIMLLP